MMMRSDDELKRFNPRAHAGRDTTKTTPYLNKDSFNPRAHAGRDTNGGRKTAIRGCFNPRAHAGRDPRSQAEAQHVIVSIHAPTRGATCGTARRWTLHSGFNPRAHAGRDSTDNHHQRQ